jgi:hypothetical protein
MRHLTLITVLSFSAAIAHANEQVRTTAPFKSIDLKGPISIEVKAGQAHSLTVRGNEKFVREVVTEVVGGELRVRVRENEKGVTTMNGDPRIIVTMPELCKFAADGAGETLLNNIRCDRLDVSYRGAGSLSIAGKAKSVKLNAQGVGKVDTKALIADDVDVNFQGVGSVMVYAKGRLDANVQGMGELTYYGKPRTINKSVAGLGRVSAGD